ncbi:predicted protein [Sclerotinia sclerotiorum 1980 UF-70]|uniref:Uncharacterized protein n=1 Tax=Sclerotinia sclerotiorum (strain ATCC 18683 / 1980 / Ss-1) TaxID=665079 RepID=A7F6H9_SCLS1|nr:predicted protein [Sclerotinia sclerotiorum 1980 UF-70]EDN98350.1 predicted protein [Sclerotinia sclerotiorum 1980 UF-70]
MDYSWQNGKQAGGQKLTVESTAAVVHVSVLEI